LIRQPIQLGHLYEESESTTNISDVDHADDQPILTLPAPLQATKPTATPKPTKTGGDDQPIQVLPAPFLLGTKPTTAATPPMTTGDHQPILIDSIGPTDRGIILKPTMTDTNADDNPATRRGARSPINEVSTKPKKRETRIFF
jgi:hypothetical protein